MRKMTNIIVSNCYKKLIILLVLKVQGFCTFSIYAVDRERRCGLNACG